MNTVSETPLLTVVIPTVGRPQWLRRAIDSALIGVASRSVDVIVVPNGPDTSWKTVAADLASTGNVRFEPISALNANAARNHGLALARGKYIRFLDDDDYLLPLASAQLDLLEDTDAEICSGLLANVDQEGHDLGILTAPKTDDFVCAAVGITGFALPTSHVYRTASLEGCRWIDGLSRRQDYTWLLALAMKKEWRWRFFPEVVGVWFQHDQARTSLVRVGMERDLVVIDTLFALHQRLDAEGRLTSARSDAITTAIWYYVNWRFPYRPLYWSRVARRALNVSATSRPSHPLFAGSLRPINPLLLEWLLLPPRQLSCFARELVRSIAGWDYRRHL